jgi:hypothetical protein
VVLGLLFLELRFFGFAQQAHAVPAKTGARGAVLVAAGAALLAGFGDAPAQGRRIRSS